MLRYWSIYTKMVHDKLLLVVNLIIYKFTENVLSSNCEESQIATPL